MLTGAYNPMLCPIHVFRSRPGVTEKLIRESLASDPTVNHEEVVAQAPAAPTVTLKRAREREASPLAQPPDGVADADEWRRSAQTDTNLGRTAILRREARHDKDRQQGREVGGG